MKTHNLKLKYEYYPAVAQGLKKFEIRFNDREYQVGDKLILNEINEFGMFTSRKLFKTITYIHSGLGMLSGYVVLGIEDAELNKPESTENGNGN